MDTISKTRLPAGESILVMISDFLLRLPPSITFNNSINVSHRQSIRERQLYIALEERVLEIDRFENSSLVEPPTAPTKKGRKFMPLHRALPPTLAPPSTSFVKLWKAVYDDLWIPETIQDLENYIEAYHHDLPERFLLHLEAIGDPAVRTFIHHRYTPRTAVSISLTTTRSSPEIHTETAPIQESLPPQKQSKTFSFQLKQTSLVRRRI